MRSESEWASQSPASAPPDGDAAPSAALLTPAAASIVEWLAEVGARWGLPAEACRVHGLLFLLARPLPTSAISEELAVPVAVAEDALKWLRGEGLVDGGANGWTTASDPWALVMHSLQRRQRQELAAAQTVLEPWRRPESTENPAIARQARALLGLVDDIAAIDAGTRGMSPHLMRGLIGLGGRAARLVGKSGRRK